VRGLLRGDTRRTRTRPDEAKGDKNIEDAEAADDTAERWVENDGHERREMAQKVVLLPEGRPWEIEKQRSKLEAQHDHQRTKNPVHG
jgi:hypothetical protein